MLGKQGVIRLSPDDEVARRSVSVSPKASRTVSRFCLVVGHRFGVPLPQGPLRGFLFSVASTPSRFMPISNIRLQECLLNFVLIRGLLPVVKPSFHPQSI